MGKGKTFGGIGIGCIVSTVIAGILLKKRKDPTVMDAILYMVQNMRNW